MEEKTQQDQKEKKGKKDKLAITGFVLGIISIFFSWIGIIPILAIIFSGVALSRTKKKEEGKTLAFVGLILGIIFTIVYMFNYGHI